MGQAVNGKELFPGAAIKTGKLKIQIVVFVVWSELEFNRIFYIERILSRLDIVGVASGNLASEEVGAGLDIGCFVIASLGCMPTSGYG